MNIYKPNPNYLLFALLCAVEYGGARILLLITIYYLYIYIGCVQKNADIKDARNIAYFRIYSKCYMGDIKFAAIYRGGTSGAHGNFITKSSMCAKKHIQSYGERSMLNQN